MQILHSYLIRFWYYFKININYCEENHFVHTMEKYFCGGHQRPLLCYKTVSQKALILKWQEVGWRFILLIIFWSVSSPGDFREEHKQDQTTRKHVCKQWEKPQNSVNCPENAHKGHTHGLFIGPLVEIPSFSDFSNQIA